MPTSDLAAAEVLKLVTKPATVTPMAWWLFLALDDPGQDLTNTFAVSELAGVHLLRDNASWTLSTNRLMVYSSDILWTPGPVADFVPWGWVIKDASTGGNPLFSRRIKSTTARAGQPVRLAGTEIAFRYPLVPA